MAHPNFLDKKMSAQFYEKARQRQQGLEQLSVQPIIPEVDDGYPETEISPPLYYADMVLEYLTLPFRKIGQCVRRRLERKLYRTTERIINITDADSDEN